MEKPLSGIVARGRSSAEEVSSFFDARGRGAEVVAGELAVTVAVFLTSSVSPGLIPRVCTNELFGKCGFVVLPFKGLAKM